ncbi:putative sulfate exporter family transporter [Kineococcus aurantiacus]|uniref:Putative integral membrane protein (TIGR00698 family) n=1 Tax=Kineococcus aurantiacus TaxID=37633 RepID=A0A7Y9ASW6_9ACTN|nr:putative integral membrane protein (TIGR00698 family) [Kineococcus aurantiacus]
MLRAVPRPAHPAAALLPGLVVVAAATLLAFGVQALAPVLTASTVAVALGAVVRSTGLFRRSWAPATGFASRRLLRVAVVLLGLQLPLSQVRDLGWGGVVLVVGVVAVTFCGTQLIGRALGLSPARSLLVATGFSICGASAIAAVRPATDADEEDVSTSIALVTLCGSLAIVVLPLLRVPLGLDVHGFGVWAGASVHDVGQVVATGDRVPGALGTAVVVKLSRVLLLAPLVALVVLRRRARDAGTTTAKRPPVLPFFVAAFVVAVAVRATGLVPGAALAGAQQLQSVLLVAALFALGTGIDVPHLVRTGARSLVLGLSSWVLVAGVALAGVHLLHVGA